MKFNQVFVEKEAIDLASTKKILDHLKSNTAIEIDSLDQFFNKFKKPYLHKRDNLNLYIGKKKAPFIKEAPDAYGIKNQKHFYFINSYNCIYECQYCYLQGYFNSPDIVLYSNYQDIVEAVVAHAKQRAPHTVWYHAGEFSDSLALSRLTQEWPLFFQAFSQIPHAWLELRTKSNQIKPLLELTPPSNVVVTFSLAPEQVTKNVDLKTPTLKARLNAMEKLEQKGYRLGVHLDPVIFTKNWKSEYQELARQLALSISLDDLKYISIGVVRFTETVFKEFKKNYPRSLILGQQLQVGEDGKVKYPLSLKNELLYGIKGIFSNYISSEKIYLCMEEESEL